LEIKALRSQMNPHFIFNALNSIQFFVFNKDVDTANLYISKFSKLLRLVLNSSESPWIPLGEEIEIIQLYLDIEALRFGDELTYKIEVDDALDDIDDMLIPSMIIQPFIENSIKHGLSSKEGAKTIRIIMTKVNDESFICSISDNGIGRNLSNQIKDQQQKLEFHKSMGMKLIEDRLNIISGQKTLNNIQIMDMFDAKGLASGTRVDILFPIKLNI
jgi:LytS/YehU family sensor histidine kinase